MQLRAWQPGDEALLVGAQPDISAASLAARFLSGHPALPSAYLRHIAAAPRERWDAQVAMEADRLLGWAEFARLSACEDEVDIAVLVVDSWQRRGVATALLDAMLPRMFAAGIRVVHADIEPRNTAARATIRAFAQRSRSLTSWGRPTGLGLSGSFTDGLLHFRMSL
jgi:RimJ/RimL family protein N-acetyltransferase